MSRSVVRPELGPSLPELLAPLPLLVRRGLLVLALVVLGGIVALWARAHRDPMTRIIIRQPVVFNIGYQSPFARIPPAAGEIVRVGDRDQWLAVSALRLPPFRGDVAGLLPLYATGIERRLERDRPGLQVRSEGRATVNSIQGYAFTYIVRGQGGHRRYGQLLLLPDDATSRSGVTIALEADAGPAITNPDMVGRTGPLKATLRSFRFGTQTP